MKFFFLKFFFLEIFFLEKQILENNFFEKKFLKKKNFGKKNFGKKNLYRSYYPHRSRDSMSPVCGIFFKVRLNIIKKFEAFVGVEGQSWQTYEVV